MAQGTTVGALLDRVRRHALLTLRGPAFILAAPSLAGATTLTITTDPSGVGEGSIVGLDSELFYIQSVNIGAKMFTVIPGWLGTAPASHASGAMCEIDPRVPKATLVDFAEQEIRSWRPKLWRVATTDVPVTSSERTYPLGVLTGFLHSLELRAAPTHQTATAGWWSGSWTGDAWPHVSGRVLRSLPASESASGFALQLTNYPSSTSLRLVYAADFDLSAFVETTDLVSEVGLRASMLDLLEEGVRWRVFSSGMMPRSDWRLAGMSRDAEEVTIVDIMRTTELSRALRNQRLADEANALRHEFPYRMSD